MKKEGCFVPENGMELILSPCYENINRGVRIYSIHDNTFAVSQKVSPSLLVAALSTKETLSRTQHPTPHPAQSNPTPTATPLFPKKKTQEKKYTAIHFYATIKTAVTYGSTPSRTTSLQETVRNATNNLQHKYMGSDPIR